MGIALPLRADSPAPPRSYKLVTLGAEYVFVMLAPGAFDRGWREAHPRSGLYRNDGSAAPLWTVDWYAPRIDVASDGVHLVRHGPWASSTGEEAISFFASGRLLRTYLIRELVDDDAKLQRSVSHFLWREEGRFDDAALSYTLKTKDGNRFVFDVRTGGLVSETRSQAQPRAAADCARTFCGCWTDTVLEFATKIVAGRTPVENVEIYCDKEETPIAVSDASGVAKFTLSTARSPGCHFARCTNLTLRDMARKYKDHRVTVFQSNGREVQLSARGAPAGGAPQVALYHLTAETVGDASVQGTVFANRWTWQCRKRQCSSRIPGRGPFADLCTALAAEVGPLRSCDAGYASLSTPELEKVNGAVPAASPAGVALRSRRFSFVSEGSAYWLIHEGRDRLPVPGEWILAPEEAVRDSESYVSSTAFDPHVQEFAVGNGSIALHASSYEISGGSAGAAAGRDVLLIVDPDGRNVADGGLRFGMTKRRLRANGVAHATTHRLYAQDIDGDGLVDIGALREQAACRGGRPSFSSDRVRWHVFHNGRWVRRPALDGRPPRSSRAAELPLLGLAKSPVDYVLERCARP